MEMLFLRRRDALLAGLAAVALLALAPSAVLAKDGGDSDSDGGGDGGGSGGGSGSSGGSGSGGSRGGDSDHDSDSDGGSGDDGGGSGRGRGGGDDDNDRDGEDDHGGRQRGSRDSEKARAKVLDREILPLREVITAAETRADDRIIGIQLKKNGRTDFYVLKIMNNNGRIRTVRLNARTGKKIGLFGF